MFILILPASVGGIHSHHFRVDRILCALWHRRDTDLTRYPAAHYFCGAFCGMSGGKPASAIYIAVVSQLYGAARRKSSRQHHLLEGLVWGRSCPKHIHASAQSMEDAVYPPGLSRHNEA